MLTDKSLIHNDRTRLVDQKNPKMDYIILYYQARLYKCIVLGETQGSKELKPMRRV